MDRAHEVAARYGNDGQVWKDANDVWLTDACEEAGARTERNVERDLTRYIFSDDSVLTLAGGGWDFGYANCWCWDGVGHNPDTCEKLDHNIL